MDIAASIYVISLSLFFSLLAQQLYFALRNKKTTICYMECSNKNTELSASGSIKTYVKLYTRKAQLLYM